MDPLASRRRLPFAVVGAGPAGLAAAAALSLSRRQVIVLDAGPPAEKRRGYRVRQLATGVGGAGLFCDGKFSYYPSGSALYQLRAHERTEMAFAWLAPLLQSVGIPCEPHVGAQQAAPARIPLGASLVHKPYPSFMSSTHQRRQLIRALRDLVAGPIIAGARVTGIRPSRSGYGVTYTRRAVGDALNTEVAGVVLATGRFGGLEIAQGLLETSLPMTELRYEFGLRVESEHSAGLLADMTAGDPKCIWGKEPITFRTFCGCRRGEVWHIPYPQLSALSGRSDRAPSNYSSFGVLVRFEGTGRAEGRAIWQWLCSHVLPPRRAAWEPLLSFLERESGASSALDTARRPWYPRSAFRPSSIMGTAGMDLGSLLREGLGELVDVFPGLAVPSTVCLFPVIEGTGLYPETDADLRVAGHAVWCAGDVVGRFRGLVAALISGYYAGTCAAEALH